MENIVIRTAAPSDAAALLEIYSPYVENTAVSFEYEPPTAEEFARRISKTLECYPYLVAESGGEILGYAYAGRFRERKAFDWAVESSVYLREDKKGRGLGRLLYEELEKALSRMNVTNIVACVACTEQEDEYLTNASVNFHLHMGYRHVGILKGVGYKFGRWYDLAYMEKVISPHRMPQPPLGK